MSSARTWMIGAGGLLVLLAILGAGARLLQPQAIPSLGAIPSPALYVTTGSVVLIGLLLVGFAPPSRRAERRVRLEPQEAVQHAVLRPSIQGGVPKTSGLGLETKPSAAPHIPLAAALASGPAPGDGAAPAGAPSVPRPAAARAAATHPNDAAADPAPIVGEARATARRTELAERLELLDLKANNAKVRFGLGKISAAGYRQYLKEVDQERTLIEAELMETEAD